MVCLHISVVGGRWCQIYSPWDSTVIVAMHAWTIDHHVVAYDTFTWNAESVIATQPFQYRSKWHSLKSQYDPATIWSFKNNRKPTGHEKTARTPENVAIVREVVIRSLNRSARNVKMSRKSGRKMLHCDMQCYPY